MLKTTYGGDATCLVLENDPLIAMGSELLLKGLGIAEVEICNSRRAAHAILDRTRPDLALVDFRLDDGTTSREIAHRLRMAGVPFAVVSGFDRPDRIAPELVVTHWLTKPLVEIQLARFLTSIDAGPDLRCLRTEADQASGRASLAAVSAPGAGTESLYPQRQERA